MHSPNNYRTSIYVIPYLYSHVYISGGTRDGIENYTISIPRATLNITIKIFR